MKKTFILFLLSFIPACIFAGEKQSVVNSKIKSVTVYLSGAEISREADVYLEPGRTTLTFRQLSSKINPATISASIDEKIKIISILHQMNYLSDAGHNKQLSLLQDSLDGVSYELEKLRMEKSALAEEQKILFDNRARLGKESGVSTAELTAAVNFYRNRLNEINGKLLNLNVRERKLDAQQQRMKKQLQELNFVQNRPASEISLIVETKSAGKATIKLKYLVSDASWSPKYDLRSKGAGSKMELDYRAEIFNNSEEDWPETKLILSTGDPSRRIERPSLDPWGLSYNSKNNYQSKVSDYEGRLNTYQPKPDDSKEISGAGGKVLVTYAETEVSELSVDFQIRDPYSIPSDNKIYLVDVNEFELDADYNYYAVPKADKDAFLVAKIVGWESLNLIEGPANVYFKNTYIGQTNLETRYSNDTLELSLGRDHKVMITRVKKQDYSSKKVIGMNRSETFTYDIDIRNTNADTIDIEVIDQVPIAQESDIEVTVHEISKAQYDVPSGKLVWKLKLSPAESKKLTISYTVKYPKNKSLVLRKTKAVRTPRYRMMY